MKKPKTENLLPEALEVTPNKSTLLPVIMGFAKLLLPNITTGMVETKDFYFDNKTGKTTLTVLIHGDKDYLLNLVHMSDETKTEYKLEITDSISDNKKVISYTEF